MPKTSITVNPKPITLSPLLPTWSTRDSLGLWDDDGAEQWPFELLFLPANALSDKERRAIHRDFSAHLRRDPEDRWNEEWIFHEERETVLAIKAKRTRNGVRTKLTPKNLAGFLSFERKVQWSEEMWADEPDEDFERDVLTLFYEPYLIYVKPEHRGQKLGYALMHILGDLFRSDLERCVAARPVRVDCSYHGEYHSLAGERVGNYCVAEFECAIDLTRQMFGWLAPIGEFHVDGGL